jgi:putative transposase
MRNIKTQGHAVFALQYHMVFVTKYGHRCLTGEMLNRLHVVFADVLGKWRCELLELDGEEDHVHLLVQAQPSCALSQLVGNLKTVSSRYLRREFKASLSRYYWKPVLWSSSYAVFTVGAVDLAIVVRYIRSQDSPA